MLGTAMGRGDNRSAGGLGTVIHCGPTRSGGAGTKRAVDDAVNTATASSGGNGGAVVTTTKTSAAAFIAHRPS